MQLEPLAVTVPQAAQLGGPKETTLWEDIRAGRLRAIRRGRCTRILIDDFKAYLASFTDPPAADRAHGQQRGRKRRRA